MQYTKPSRRFFVEHVIVSSGVRNFPNISRIFQNEPPQKYFFLIFKKNLPYDYVKYSLNLGEYLSPKVDHSYLLLCID